LFELIGPPAQICAHYLQQMLAAYAADPLGQWKHKDASLYLVTALLATSARTQAGVTKVSRSGLEVSVVSRAAVWGGLRIGAGVGGR
jgi:hypothetical protein